MEVRCLNLSYPLCGDHTLFCERRDERAGGSGIAARLGELVGRD